MSQIPDVANSGDLDSLPSWISDHLGEGSSYMTDEVNQSPASPMDGSPTLETNPLATIHPLVEEKNNIMTLEELNSLRKTYYFPPGVRVRLPEEGETIVSARLGEVAFYEAAFPAGLCFPIHSTIRLILQFYNICPAQLVPNAWRSIACSMAWWRVFKYTLSLSEFRNLFSLNSNPKPNQGWLYFKARNKKTLLGGYPSNVKGWKSKLFFVTGDEWEFPEGTTREGAPRVPRTWGVPGSMASGTAGEERPGGGAPSSSGDAARARILQPNPTRIRAYPPSLTLNQMAIKLFHVIGQALVLGSSLAIKSREAGEHASLQEGRATSIESEVTRLQKLSADLEQQLAEARSGVLVVELREALNKAKESAIKEFKSSLEFLVAIEDSTSKYFGEGFEFCKVQLRRHHPDFAIDLGGTVLDQNLLAEQDEAAKEKEKLGENEGGGEQDAAPLYLLFIFLFIWQAVIFLFE
ncbi:hypothetical protein Acr_25g0002710 [Actinidia rufa]|uniref:Transposase (putative) gypsy type domain-containing protein n=1 Tax=Actinidia rufa TaxID=165716 RepID=A0A7J0GYJ2_9ERIC|nr:hypothetical protein Acr_25g0002710 [Actinidia rufa]